MHAKSWDHGGLAGAEVWPWSKPGQSNPLLFSFDGGLILGGLSFGDRRLRHQSELGVSSCSGELAMLACLWRFLYRGLCKDASIAWLSEFVVERYFANLGLIF
jgi:hypothetical protein